ncbi:MAG: PEGA domain-containing protein [Gammaproteobacteria bacterium]|nr:MAG: PEGA domain-containing protein [Gammaproteobacteria bacterium]
MEIPGYIIEKKIGHGGMATVYLAEQTSLERKVAIKVMAPALAADSSFTERFLREGKTIAQLAHSNIISIYDIGVSDTSHYISMEFIGGGDLKDKIQQGQLKTEEVIEIIKQIASALGFAHTKGFIHRDIKPENILFKEDGTAILTDFGIAKTVNSDTRMTGTGMSIGTLHYMSPEQARVRTLDGRSDLYSLGVVLYEMLTGEVPYDAEDTIAIAYAHVNNPIPELPAVHANMQPILDRLLAKEPEDRYADTDELIDNLKKIERGINIPRPQFAVEATQILQSANAKTDKPKNKSSFSITPFIPIILILMLAMTALGGGYYFFLRDSGTNTPIIGGNPKNDIPEEGNKEDAPEIAGTPVQEEGSSEKPPVKDTEGEKEDNTKTAGTTPTKGEDNIGGQPTPNLQNDHKTTYQPAATGYGILDIKSSPEGATVLLGNNIIGQTPLTIKNISAGRYTLSITHPYHTTYSKEIDLKKDTVLKENVQLKAGKGAITIVTEPAKASVLIDGKLAQGVTPLTVKDIATGEHNIKITMQSYETIERNVNLKNGTTEIIDITLSGGDIKTYKHDKVWVGKDEKIAKLLEEAEEDMKKGRYSSPKGKNALEKYRAILKIDKNDQDAIDGVSRISGIYAKAAKKYALNMSFSKYRNNLRTARSISKNHPAVKAAEATYKKMLTISGRTFSDKIAKGVNGPVMIGILPNKFIMGDIRGDGDRDENPSHEVKVYRRIAMGKYEVSFAEYDQYVRATGARSPSDNGWGRGNRPVINVSWNEAVAYTKWLTKVTGHKYRLPTEAEWEFAARAGSKKLYSWGDSVGVNKANCKSCGSSWDNRKTAPVNSFRPNRFGLHNVHGNVWEWTLDCPSENYDNTPKNGAAYTGSNCGYRVIRGGCYISKPKMIKSANRGKGQKGQRSAQYGFRIVREYDK